MKLWIKATTDARCCRMGLEKAMTVYTAGVNAKREQVSGGVQVDGR
jgi:hypothetical protein